MGVGRPEIATISVLSLVASFVFFFFFLGGQLYEKQMIIATYRKK
jgi:hypothetical protein